MSESKPTVGLRAGATTSPGVRLGNVTLGFSRALELVRAYPVAAVAIVGGLTSRLVFWAMTDRKFEDGLITVTNARNAAEGYGLTHHPGEHSHSFTSAISVLVPLPGELIHTNGGGLVALRLASLVAVVVAIVCATAIGRELGISHWLMIFPLAYLAFDQNQIFYGMSGMETEMATAILLAGIYAVMRERIVITGVLLGLALLVRPDFILWALPALVYLFFRNRRSAYLAGGVALGTVLPWVIFASIDYGSPIPNTLRSKSARYPTNFPSVTDPIAWVTYSWDRVSNLYAFTHAWTPLLENGFVLRTPVPSFGLTSVAFTFMALTAIGVWWARRTPAWIPAAAYGVLFVLFRIYFLPPDYYEWYLGPFMALAAIAAAAGLASLGRLAPVTVVVVSCGLALAFSAHMPTTFVLEGRIQHDIEDRVRVPMAKYLEQAVRPGEIVVSESAGYVGYYSHVKLYDYPGLTSPGSYNVLHKLGPGRNSLFELANAVRSKWLILRPHEWEALKQYFPETAALYKLDREFSVPVSESNTYLRGVYYINIDRDFLVLRLK